MLRILGGWGQAEAATERNLSVAAAVLGCYVQNQTIPSRLSMWRRFVYP